MKRLWIGTNNILEKLFAGSTGFKKYFFLQLLATFLKTCSIPAAWTDHLF